jgi:hypothetical protein
MHLPSMIHKRLSSAARPAALQAAKKRGSSMPITGKPTPTINKSHGKWWKVIKKRRVLRMSLLYFAELELETSCA